MLIKLVVVIGFFVAIAFALRHAPRSGRRNGDPGSWAGDDGDVGRHADGHGHHHGDGTTVGDSGGHDGGGDSGGGDGGGGDGGGGD